MGLGSIGLVVDLQAAEFLEHVHDGGVGFDGGDGVVYFDELGREDIALLLQAIKE
jgi:hypothetical protein